MWFDRRDAELLGHTVHIESGLCRIDFLIDGKKASFELFADMTADRLWGRMVSASGEPVEAPFKYITVLPDSTTPPEFPKYTTAKDNSDGMLSFRQVLPFQEMSAGKPYSKHPRDKAFCLTTMVNSGFNGDDMPKKMGPLQCGFTKDTDFVLCFDLENGKESLVPFKTGEAKVPSWKSYNAAAAKSR